MRPRADFQIQGESVAREDATRKIVNVGQRSATFCLKRPHHLQRLALFGNVQQGASSCGVVFKLERKASVRVWHAVN